MPEITLRNTRRQPFLATVYHHIVCRRTQVCSCQVQHVVGPKGKRVARKNPDSFQVNALSELKVDARVRHLPQVKAALKSGWLVQKEVKVPKGEAEGLKVKKVEVVAAGGSKKKGRG